MPTRFTTGTIERLRSLRGHGTDAQYEGLARLASLVTEPHCIVEIGTFRGKSAAYMASAASEGVVVYTIDPHDLPGYRAGTGIKHSRRNYSDPKIRLEAQTVINDLGLHDRCVMIRDFGEEVGRRWDGPQVGLLYIDGDHREGAVRRDFSAWEKHLAPNATVVFDDHTSNFPGVFILIDRLEAKGTIERIQQVDGMLVTRFLK